MVMIVVKKCEDCKAFNSVSMSCFLNYRVELKFGEFDSLYAFTQEKCPKPMTFKKFTEISLERDAKLTREAKLARDA